MVKINYKWDWQADKPSQIHCGFCGFAQIVIPSATDLKDGFLWHCVKCSAKFTYNDPNPKIDEPNPIERSQSKIEEQVLGYPQTKRLFERKKISEWLVLMVGENILVTQKVSGIATKLKAYYRFRFGRNPTKSNNYNSYSGIELNTCIERMFVIDKPLADELQMLHLEQIRREVEVGSIIVGNKGIPREVLKLIDDNLFEFKSDDGLTKKANLSRIVQIIHPNQNKGF